MGRSLASRLARHPGSPPVAFHRIAILAIALPRAVSSTPVLGTAQGFEWSSGPSLPRPVTNNAVAAVETSRGLAVFSFLGLDSTKRWNGVVNWAFRWNLSDAAWREIAPVPGPGRLAATARAVGGRIYLLGGYTVQADGSEQSQPNVDIYDPEHNRWSRGAPIPVPVDDAVSGVWRDSLIYLISGWHDRDNVTAVQIYDPACDTWQTATPIRGPPVFGHAGAIVGNTIVYIDGVRVDSNPRRFALEQSSWRGEIDPTDPTSIAWSRLPDHPGPGLYRAVAGGAPGAEAAKAAGEAAAAAGRLILFAGGTGNPYNYNGIGYNGVPSQPRSEVFGYDLESGRWPRFESLPYPVMDLRGMAVGAGRVYLVGGMGEDQQVSRRVLLGNLR